MKIIHTADVQVKNREKALFHSTNKTLREIENIVKTQKAEILIIAGDLFEYATPTDSERKLMYNHLSKLLNIDSLLEIVLMAGNHDLLKDKKQSESTIGNNPINVFVDLLNNLDKEKSDKIIYINESKVYNSKVCKNIEYYGFSLEDNQDFKIDENEIRTKFPICLHHGMLKEYVDFAKVPLRKDIYQALDSIELFPKDSLICAGDIHINLTFDGLNGQKYIYPGSPIQHTHNEGSFIQIGEECKIQTLAETKCVKCYEFDENKINLKLEDIKISDLYLQMNVNYVTLILDNKINFETIKQSLLQLETMFSDCQTFVKVKSSNVFVKHEQTILNLLSSLFDKKGYKKYDIYFEYDKLIQQAVTVNNKVIQEILVEKNEELKSKSELNANSSEENSELNLLNTASIDDLILSDKQLEKLFASVLDLSLKSVEDSDISNQELATDIRTLFQQQIELVYSNLNSKRYAIKLIDIETNGFMALTENKINLDIPGITRILGTNGIGKTTLYNMIRWVWTGEVFEDMSKNTVTKNNLIIFNKKNIDVDFVTVIHNVEINNLPVVIKRTAERKWKNNTTDEQKKSLKWKSFVSAVDKTIEFSVTTKSGEVKKFVGENAEKSLSIYIGDVIDNILFINQHKIKNLLLKSSDKLNELVLNFVGVDYLNNLENNLDSVKTELMNVTKPTKSKDDLIMQMTDAKLFLKKNEELSVELLNNKKSMETEIDDVSKKLTKTNNKLLNIGNIPQLIENDEIDAIALNEYLSNFEIKTKKEKIQFNEIKPELNQIFIDEINSNIDKEKETIDKLIESKNKTAENISLLIDKDLRIYIETVLNANLHQEESIKNNIGEINLLIKNGFEFVQNSITTTIDKLKEKLDLKTKEKTELYLKLNSIFATIKANDESLKSGICYACSRPFSEDFESHKIELEKENISLNTEKEVLEKSIEDLKPTITKINTFINTYSEYRDLAIKQDLSICDIEVLQKDNEYYFNIIKGNINKKSEENEKLFNVQKTIIKINKLDRIKYQEYPDYKISGELEFIVNKHSDLLEKIKEIDLQIIDISEKIKDYQLEITKIQNKFNIELKEYSDLQTENIRQNNLIDEFNSKVIEHNNQKNIKESEYDKICLKLIKLKTESLPIYVELKKEYDYDNSHYNELNEIFIKINQNISDNLLSMQRNSLKLQECEQLYANYLKYQKNNLVWKIYSKLIKNNFKEIIFEYYRNFLNLTLNNLLVDVNFKLFWNEDSELYHVDYQNGFCSYQPVQQSSGMETTYLGLALIYTIHLLNIKNSISHIFIDEISGTLNAGTELTYEAENYKELLVMVLNKFKDKQIFIIDHSIDNLYQTITYEVQPTTKGSKYIQI